MSLKRMQGDLRKIKDANTYLMRSRPFSRNSSVIADRQKDTRKEEMLPAEISVPATV